MKKRFFAALASLCVMMSALPIVAFAEEAPDSSTAITEASALCEHHPSHDAACGYTEGTAEMPCGHEHTDECYAIAGQCVHTAHDESCGGLAEPTACTHVCSEESGCITKTLACKHEHDEACGYVPATEGTLCTFVCEVCSAQDSGNPAAPSDAQPEECTCEKLCTGEEINADCPVCSVEGAELDKVCVGVAPMLPVTALAAGEDAPGTLWVGRTQITARGYWKTTTEGNFETGSENDYNVYYDGNGTLTLNGATIQGGTSTVSVPYGAGIYAQCSNGQSVTLTIKLIGENTITGTFGIYVNAEINASSYGTNATLTIMGDNNGSLEVSGSNNGIYVKSGTGNASLNIKNVAVTSSTNDNYAAGVYVMSSNYATNSPNISLSVDGGSLTASSTGSRDGILFYVGSSQATGATTSLTVSENAIVDARNGGISALKISETLPTPTPTGDNRSGIVFNGTEGTVYGNVSLNENLTIGEGESLTIPDGASLTIDSGATLTVNGGELTGNIPTNGVVYKVTEVKLDKTSLTLNVGKSDTLTATITPDNATDQNVTWSSDNESVATVDTNGKVTATGTGTTTIKATVDGKSAQCTVTVNAAATGPTITTQPSNQSVTEGDPVTFSVAATGSGTLTYQWQQSTDGGNNWTDISGANSATYTITTTTAAMNDYQYRCTVTGTDGHVTSYAAILTVNRKTGQGTGSSGSSGGSGSSYREREYDFWMDVRDEIRHADPGDTVKANARTYDRMPWSVMEALRNADGVTLHITWNGGEDIIIPSEAALSEQSRVYYPLSYLEDMTFEVESEAPAADPDKVNPETGGILEVTAPAVTTPAGEPEATDSRRGLAETPELADEGIEQPLPGVYEPEETVTTSTTEETGTSGLWIAGVVAVLAAAGGFWFWKRKKQA